MRKKNPIIISQSSNDVFKLLLFNSPKPKTLSFLKKLEPANVLKNVRHNYSKIHGKYFRFQLPYRLLITVFRAEQKGLSAVTVALRELDKKVTDAESRWGFFRCYQIAAV